MKRKNDAIKIHFERKKIFVQNDSGRLYG